MATIYVDAAMPNDSGNGLTWGTAKKTISAAVNASSIGGVVEIAAGLYTTEFGSVLKSGLQIHKTANPAHLTGNGGKVSYVRFSGSYVFYHSAALSSVSVKGIEFDGANSSCIFLYSDGAATDLFSLLNCKFKNSTGALWRAGGAVSNHTISNCDIDPSWTGTILQFSNAGSGVSKVSDSNFHGREQHASSYFLNMSGWITGGIEFERCTFKGKPNYLNNFAFNISNPDGTPYLKFSQCIHKDSESVGNAQVFAGALYHNDNVTNIEMNDPVIIGSVASFLYTTKSPIITVNNPIIIGNTGPTRGSIFVYKDMSPTITFNNPYVIGDPVYSDNTLNYGTINNQIASYQSKSNMGPLWYGGHGCLVPSIDDTGINQESVNYAKDVADVFKARGKKITFGVVPGNGVTPRKCSEVIPTYTGWGDLVSPTYDDTVVWATHGLSHDYFTGDVLTAFTIKKSSGRDLDVDTITISETSLLIQSTNPDCNIELDLTSDAYGGLVQVYNAISSTGKWVLGATPVGSKIRSDSIASILLVTIPSNSEAALTVIKDTVAPEYRHFRNEISIAKEYVQQLTGKDVNCMIYPGSGITENLIDWMLLNEPGIRIARGGTSDFYAGTNRATIDDLRNINTHAMGLCATSKSFGPSLAGSRTEAEVKSYAARCAVFARYTGRVIWVFAHTATSEGVNSITPQEWGWFIDGAEEAVPGIISDPIALAGLIYDSGDWTQDSAYNERWTRYFDSDQQDYHLQPTSPLLGAGTKIPGINTDVEGNPLYPPYNIGPYGLSESALGVATVTNDGPPRSSITRLTGTSVTINPTGTYILDDTNAWRIVTNWTAGTANDFFDETGVPIPFTGQQAIDAGIGPRFYCGLKGIAGYTVDQDAAANAKIIRTLKVPTYIDTLYWSDSAEMDWSASNE